MIRSSIMSQMRPRHPPQSPPAPHARVTSSIDAAPPSMTRSTCLSVTARQTQTNILVMILKTIISAIAADQIVRKCLKMRTIICAQRCAFLAGRAPDAWPRSRSPLLTAAPGRSALHLLGQVVLHAELLDEVLLLLDPVHVLLLGDENQGQHVLGRVVRGLTA